MGGRHSCAGDCPLAGRQCRPAGRVQVAITMDLSATFVAACGRFHGGAGLEGIDLLPILGEPRRPSSGRFLARRARTGSAASGAERGLEARRWRVKATPVRRGSRSWGARRSDRRASGSRASGSKAMLDAWEKEVDAEAA